MTDRGRQGPALSAAGFVAGAAAWIAGAAAWIAAAGLPEDQPIARWIGMLLFHFVAALLIRWIYTRKQSPRPRLISPTLFLIAAGVALLGRFGTDPAEAAAFRTGGWPG